MCDTRVLLLHDGAALSPVIRELFCQSVRSLSAAFADEPAGPYVRLLWLLTRDLRATSPLARLTPRVKRPVYHAHRHAAATSASITVASVRVALAASLRVARNRAGDKWLAEIGALKREVFSKWLIIIIDRQAADKS